MTTQEIQIVQQALGILHRLVPDDEPRGLDPRPRHCPVQAFAKRNLVLNPVRDMTTQELWEFYSEVAIAGEAERLSRAVFLRVLPGAMAAVFGLRKSHAIRRSEQTMRGFSGITIQEQATPMEHLVIDE